MNKQELWNLRCEIVLDALYTKCYSNTYNICECICQRFFDGYSAWLQVNFPVKIFYMENKNDTIDNLWNYYCSLEFNPFINVSRKTKE